jgi:membrane peptidoglycan carboxypeptidase
MAKRLLPTTIRQWRRGIFRLSIFLSLPILLFILLSDELNSCRLQAIYFTFLSRKMTFSLQQGRAESAYFPAGGPYDIRLGYARFPVLFERLKNAGYDIVAQSSLSSQHLGLVKKGIFPIYDEKDQTGLRILDCHKKLLYSTQYPIRVYDSFDSIPDVVVKTLLFIENQELLDLRFPYRNPAVEWDRLAKAVLDSGLKLIKKDFKPVGGSTLATQLEKFRHSSRGYTSSAMDKLQQMGSATLRAYHHGKNTFQARQDIIVSYINSVPLAAFKDHGEVNGLGDGLWIWYSADFQTVNRLLSMPFPKAEGDDALAWGRAYKQVLSLFLAHRRPSYFLLADRKALERLTAKYTYLLAEAGIITQEQREVVKRANVVFRESFTPQVNAPFGERKAVYSMRTYLSQLLGIRQLYDLDRLDLIARSTLNQEVQKDVTRFLTQLRDPSFSESAGIIGFHLLPPHGLEKVIYSFTLYEHVNNANLLRIQTDNLDQPFNINEGVKLELGSTAKLRTLVTYLQIITENYELYRKLSPEDRKSLHASTLDVLSRWVLEHLDRNPKTTLKEVLNAALERRYSAHPGERFFTGGGLHTFVNFDKEDDSRIMSVREAFRNSVNLVFIRLMRDIVKYYMYHIPGPTAQILKDVTDPKRQEYLSRFADLEGQAFIRRFYQKYKGKTSEEMIDILLQGTHPTPKSLASIFRTIAPEESSGEFVSFMKRQLPDSQIGERALLKLYEGYSPVRLNLNDRAYIARKHPFELWTISYLRRHPAEASLAEAIKASATERQEAYSWLFKTHRKNVQDRRIKTLIELEAFDAIYQKWKTLGYPFSSLVPSYATAIGSSADRPAVLAELVGIILNDGVLYPTVKVEQLHFAKGTPYEAILDSHPSEGERVLPSEVAAALREELIGVVDKGSAVRAYRAFRRSDGSLVPVGGKTGTGDNRADIFGPKARFIRSKVLNRTATFVFMIGDRFFGTMTAYVPGSEAGNYKFTSSLPVQILKKLAPSLMALIDNTPATSKAPEQ